MRFDCAVLEIFAMVVWRGVVLIVEEELELEL
jgi:hypothetical protein